MNAVITDVATLESLSPVDLSAYLRANGWEPRGVVRQGIVAQWLRTQGGVLYDVLVPLNREVQDFTRRVSETLATLALVEHRSQLEVLSDLQDSTADVVRWRCIQNDSSDGTISLEQGHQLIAQARSQLLAAACSAVSARQYFASRKPTQAVDYISKARLAQSERGSYIIAVRSPVTPHLNFEEENSNVVPFERRAVETLASGLTTLIEAATAAMRDVAPNREDIAAKGVSANLCDAMATMLTGEARRSVEVIFSYATTRASTNNSPRTVRFFSDLSPVISAIGRDLRETAIREDFELIGFVADLSRGPSEEIGTATIQGLVDGEFRRVELRAESADYAILTYAHTDKRPIACVGELLKQQGRTFRLRNARAFQIVEDN